MQVPSFGWMQKMQADVPGFQILDVRHGDKEKEDKLKHVAFYYDGIHPDGNTGAR
jgi:hypothetical protein